MSIEIRKNIQNLSEDELRNVRNAYKAMKAIADNRGYTYLAGLHGIPGQWCWHYARSLRTLVRAHLFLPWHRAYLYWFEQYAQDRIAGVTIPYWDWSVEQDIPTAFSDQKTVLEPFAGGGQPKEEDNSLYKGRIIDPNARPKPIDEDTIRSTDHSNDGVTLPTTSDVNKTLNESDFNYFSDSLEGLHDSVHVWVGGSMSQVPIAAFDPIFWSHHCMVDRLWYIWQINNTPEKGLETMLDAVLAPFNLRVKDVVNVRDLGYDYAGTEVKIPGTIEV